MRGADIMSPQKRRMLQFLQANRGRILSHDDLIQALYPNPDDEPDDAIGLVRVILSHLRREHGVAIETVRGYRLPALRSAPGAIPAGEEA